MVNLKQLLLNLGSMRQLWAVKCQEVTYWKLESNGLEHAS